MNSKTKNICEVVADMLCHSCGACAGICPTNAINYYETTGGYLYPKIEKGKCIHCGNCYEVCSGINISLLEKMECSFDPFEGVSLKSYIGRAIDDRIYSNSQSGGVVSGLLINALRSGYIEFAVVVDMQAGIFPRPEVRLVSTEEQILESQKSKYCPVPVLKIVRQLLTVRGPVALVGLPCHVHGLANLMLRIPELKQKIRYIIGLFCDRVMTCAAIDFLIGRTNLTRDSEKKFHFRDKSCRGYPGDVRISVPEGKSAVLPLKERLLIKDFFTPARCRICFDKMNVFSDVTIGDPHGFSNYNRFNGESVVIVRSDKGLDIVNNALLNGVMDLREVEYSQVIFGQGIGKKRDEWRAFTDAWKILQDMIPSYCEKIRKNSLFLQRSNNVDKKCKEKLKHALSLDNYNTRVQLFRHARYAAVKKNVFDIVEKIFSRITRNYD